MHSRLVSVCFAAVFCLTGMSQALAQPRAGGRSESPTPPAAAPEPPPATAPAAPTDESKAIIDENWKVSASTMQAQVIKVASAERLRVSVEGVANYGKGFKVRILPGKVWKDYLADKVTKKALEDFPSELTGRYARTLSFQPGEWAVAVQNSENFLKSVTVHVVVRQGRKQDK